MIKEKCHYLMAGGYHWQICVIFITNCDTLHQIKQLIINMINGIVRLHLKLINKTRIF